ncbi:MAG: PAS domain S-box protein [Candidatus Melainabacteria bacterium]|nr:PAS domain S-box protein [Candidatus Melainabacteria bacterium]
MPARRIPITISVTFGITVALLALISATLVSYSQQHVFLIFLAIAMVSLSALFVLYFVNEKEHASSSLAVKLAVTKLLAQSSDLSTETGETALASICEPFDFQMATIWQIDESSNSLSKFCSWYSSSFQGNANFASSTVLNADQATTLPIRVWTTATIQTVDDFRCEHDTYAQQAIRTGLRSAVAFPITFSTKVLAVVELFSDSKILRKRELFELLTAIGSDMGQFVQRTLMEAQRKLSEQQLEKSEKMFRQLADNVDDVFLIYKANEPGSSYVSPMFEKIYGFAQEKQLKDKFAFLKVVHKEDRRSVHTYLNNLASDRPDGIEFRVIHPDRSVHWIFGRLFPALDANGKLLEIYGISTDVTQRKEAERTMKDFYSTLSHELRTPLSSIHASLRLMESGLAGPLTEKSSHLVAMARKESDRLIRMLNEILDAHKLEAGMLQFNPKPTEISSIVETSVHALKGMAEDKAIKIVKTIEWNKALLCDQDRIVQVLVNILSNAIKFSPNGGMVQLRVTHTDDTVRFSISDEGQGIPKDKQHLLFRKFQQLGESNGQTGTGLGLAISKEIIERHHGKIGIQSDAGAGATFYFELPTKTELTRNAPALSTYQREPQAI